LVATLKIFPESVGIKELKAHLSEFVERARQGRRVVVTDRGEPVAELIPLSRERQNLAQLAAAGKLRWSGGKPKGLRGLTAQGEPVSETVLQARR
jgi:prevent-host-death family protein